MNGIMRSFGNQRFTGLALLFLFSLSGIFLIFSGYLIASGRILQLIVVVGFTIIYFFLYQKSQYFLPLYFIFMSIRFFGISWGVRGGNIYLGDFLIVIVVAIIVLKKIMKKEKISMIYPDIPIFLLLLLSILLLFRSIQVNGYNAVRESAIFTFVFLYFITRESLRNFKHIDVTFKWYFIFSVIIFISCLVSLSKTISTGLFFFSTRPNVVFMGAGRGLFLLFTVIFLITAANKLHWPNIAKIVVLFSYLIIIALSQVRTSYVALAVSVILAFLFTSKKAKMLVGSLAVLLLIMLVFKFTLTPKVSQRVYQSIRSPLMYRADRTSQWRITVWQHEINRDLSNVEHFLIGRLLGSYYDITVLGNIVSTHNSYIDFFSKTGLIGICLLLWFIASVYSYLIPAVRTTKYGNYIFAVVVCFTVLLVHLFTYPGLYQRGTGVFIGILSGIGVNLRFSADREKEKGK